MFHLLLATGLLLSPTVSSQSAAKAVSHPESVLSELQAGNLRFVEGRRTRSLQSAEDPRLRERLAAGQQPQAVVITCSDSRLSDNFIFDQELGRLFTIRSAGNSPDLQAIASAEYAVEQLGCRVVVVMGHTGCGAVKAVAEAKGAPLPGNLWTLQAAMAGLLEAAPRGAGEDPKGYHQRLASVNAVRQAKAMVARSELLRSKVGSGRVRVLPAVYDLASGQVTFLEAAPPAPSNS